MIQQGVAIRAQNGASALSQQNLSISICRSLKGPLDSIPPARLCGVIGLATRSAWLRVREDRIANQS